MKNAENIKMLNQILDRIKASTDKILELEKLVKYDFSEGRLGERKDYRIDICSNSLLSFEVECYLSKKHNITMSNGIVKSMCNMLNIAILEETEYLNRLESEYNKILLEIKNG